MSDAHEAQENTVEQVITRARNLLDDCWDDENDIDRAERLLQDVMFIAPERGAIWQGLGDVRWLNGEHDIALAHYERARDLGVDNAALWGRMATSYAEFHQRDDALAAIDRALRLAPADESALDYFILIVSKLKLWNEPTVREQALRVANRAEELASQELFVQGRVIGILVKLRTW
ncbi:MAG TPA: tetratricopeptide repeat protein [Ktedonobacterales bacterium]